MHNLKRIFHLLLFLFSIYILDQAPSSLTYAEEETVSYLEFQSLPDLPDPLGVAAPFAGVHNDALIIAGGANFPAPVWENDKVWHDKIYVLVKEKSADREEFNYVWKTEVGTLAHPIAYGCSVSSKIGLICMGGNDGKTVFDDVFALQWNPAENKVTQKELPSLPSPCAFGQATLLGDTIYLAGGQSGNRLDSAMQNFWSLDLSKQDVPAEFQWKELTAWPGPTRALNLTLHQHNGYNDCVYVISGRRQNGETVELLKDVWEYRPKLDTWAQKSDSPTCLMAGTGFEYGQSHLFVVSGDAGELFGKADELKDDHPGFSKVAWSYHTITDVWQQAGSTPANHVTTNIVNWDNRFILPSGEIRPRVRSAKIWSILPHDMESNFGTLNYFVLFTYLLSMVLIGVYFTFKNKNTDDYFRAGKQIPWWAAGCSIFATMLSSLTFTGIPSKSYAQDWVYAVGNFMIPVVAVIAVFLVLPFYRRIDATSAYEYLEKRFNLSTRLFGSLSFCVFHVFRMAVVMSLTGLALAVATPLTPTQSVLLMGGLSIIYCTMGGIEAVIWTDTIQTLVLLSGALIAFVFLIMGADGGFSGFMETANAAQKFNIANFHWDITSAQVALWVIIVGAIAQNFSSYAADQAVVQRYMITETKKQAANSIWLNAALAIPATLIFFGMGTALFVFYHDNPDKLDPSISTDQIFPLFISRELPIGLAGLIVAGIFSAAQSTVSTSMNSIASAVVTDFSRPFNLCKSEQGYFRTAQAVTFLVGVLGTVIGLFFVNPDIKSLFDTFLKVIGIFMGCLGGLFLLGAATQRANGPGAIIGAFSGAAVMIYLWYDGSVKEYFYTAAGISSCFVIGYLSSLCIPSPPKNLTGLTMFTLSNEEKTEKAP